MKNKQLRSACPARRKFIKKASLLALSPALHSAPLPGGESNKLPDQWDTGRTWVEVEGKISGARTGPMGPLGGGTGYQRTVTRGDLVARDLESLIGALAEAKSGQTVFIPAETEIDFTSLIVIDKLVLEIPEGVTLAGNRGENGSLGALLYSDVLDTPVMLRAKGPDVRITGIRLRGPNPKRYMDHYDRSFGPGGQGHAYYYKVPLSGGISTIFPHLEVDNCEISAFAHSGISLRSGTGHHIHHSRIFNCQYNGLGYGICQGGESPESFASSVIEYNLFNSNRHSIAGTGLPGCGYIARNNVEIGTSLSHCFDMHGGINRKDGTNIAGTSIEIYNNTFRSPELVFAILGEPERHCNIFNNWILGHQEVPKAFFGYNNKRVHIYDNVYGRQPSSSK